MDSKCESQTASPVGYREKTHCRIGSVLMANAVPFEEDDKDPSSTLR